MANWIFVFNSSDDIFAKRISDRRWPIFPRTFNKKKIRKMDKAIFYKAGMDGKRFVGTANIVSSLKASEDGMFVEIDDVDLWKKSVLMQDVLQNLKFIEKKKSWGNYLMGGVRGIDNSDLSRIISKLNRK